VDGRGGGGGEINININISNANSSAAYLAVDKRVQRRIDLVVNEEAGARLVVDALVVDTAVAGYLQKV
jgi:hypothetical protein